MNAIETLPLFSDEIMGEFLPFPTKIGYNKINALPQGSIKW